MNTEHIPESLKYLISQYKASGDNPTEEKFKNYIRKLNVAKLRRNPSRSIIQWNDHEAIQFIYS